MSFLRGVLTAGKSAVKFLSGNSMLSSLAKTAILGFAVNKLSKSALKGNDNDTKNIDEGVRLQAKPDAAARIPVLYGGAFFGGNISDAAMSNANKRMTYCLVLSEKTGNLFSTGAATTYLLNNVFLNNQRIVFREDGITADFTVDSTGVIDRSVSGLIQIYFYAGGRTAGQKPVGFAGAVPNSESVFPNWTAGTHAMTNLVFAIVEVNYNRERNVTGLPDVLFNVTSSMKFPGDVVFDYLTNTTYGAGIDAAYVIGADVTALNAFADSSVAYADQGTGAQTLADRYQINGVIDTNNAVLANAEKILTSAASWLSYDTHTGQWGIVINKVDTSIASFDDTNILGSISLSGTGLQDLYNQVKVEFPHRELRDSADFINISIPTSSPPADWADFSRNSNEEDNVLNLTYDIVNEPIQAQLLGLIELKQSRLDKIIQFQTDFGLYNLKAGDVIDVTNVRFSFVSKLFRIITITEQQDDDGALKMDITALEYNANVYSVVDLFRFTRSDNNGIITIGSIGTPGTPTVTKIEVDARPRIQISSLAPTGVIEGLEYWQTTDVNEGDDANRSYVLIGVRRPEGGGVFTSGTPVVLEFVSSASNFFVKTRGINSTTVGLFSAVSGLVEFAPTQVTDAIGPDTGAIGAAGQLLTALAVIDLLQGLDELYSGVTGNDSIFQKIFEAFEEVTGIDLVSDAANGIIELTIKEEGVTVAASTSIINFVGSNVTATAAGNTVTVTVNVPEFTGETVLIEGTPEIGQTIAWNGEYWIPIDACCDNMPGPGEPGAPPPPTPPQCFLTLSNTLPSDRTTFAGSDPNDPVVASGSPDSAPINGNYFMRFTLNSNNLTGLFAPLSIGTGNVRLFRSDGTIVQSLPAASLVITGNVVTLPFSQRELATDFYILMDQGVVTYCQCISPAITSPLTLNFNTIPSADSRINSGFTDTYAPLTSTVQSPAFNGLVLQSVTSPACPNKLVINTSANNMVKGSGTLTVQKVSDNAVVSSFSVASGTVSGNTITFDGLNIPGGFYYLLAPSGILRRVDPDCKKEANNTSAAVTNPNSIQFQVQGLLYLAYTVDSTPFQFADAERVRVNKQTQIKLSFNRSVFFRPAAAGNFSIFLRNADNTVRQEFRTLSSFQTDGSSETMFIQANVLTLNPTKDLVPGNTYFVTVQTNALQDTCGNLFSGISSDSVIRFTVDAGVADPYSVANDIIPFTLGATSSFNLVTTQSRKMLLMWTYSAAELNAAGLSPSSIITTLRFLVTLQPANQPFLNYTIGMKNGTFQANTNPGSTGYTIVKNPSSESFTTADTVYGIGTAKNFTFNTNFTYTGGDLAIAVSFTNTTGGGVNGQTRIGNGTLFFNQNEFVITPLINTDATDSNAINSRPVVQLLTT